MKGIHKNNLGRRAAESLQFHFPYHPQPCGPATSSTSLGGGGVSYGDRQRMGTQNGRPNVRPQGFHGGIAPVR